MQNNLLEGPPDKRFSCVLSQLAASALNDQINHNLDGGKNIH